MEEYRSELNRTISFIKQADTKVGVVATFFVVLLSSWTLNLQFIRHHHTKLEIVFYFLSGLTALFLGFFMIRCLMPRLKIKKLGVGSLIYYGSIVKMKPKSFIKNRSSISQKILKEQYLEQIYITSIIANKKMNAVRKTIFLILLFALETLLLIAISTK
jgi:hypothetical protein